MGFTIVPHIWVPEKIAHDCTGCALFRRCGQHAVMLALRAGVTVGPELPAAIIHGTRTTTHPATGAAVVRRSSGRGRSGRGDTGVTGAALQPDVTFTAIDGGITAPRGFRAAGVACGIKASGGLDLSLVVSDTVASAAAVFTTNLAKAAPVLLSREHLAQSGGLGRAVVDQQRLRQRVHRR